jgi:integrase
MSVRLRKWKDLEGREQEAWHVDVVFEHPDGRVERVRKASPVNTRRGAENYERELRNALLSGVFGKEPTREVPTLEEFQEKFFVHALANNKHSTADEKKRLCKQQLLPAFGKRRLDQIGAYDIEKFKAKLLSEGLRPKTVNNALAILHKLLVLAKEWGELPGEVVRVRLLKTPRPMFDFLSFEEADRLVAKADAQWRAMIVTALHTGLRRGELAALTWEDVQLETRRLIVRQRFYRGKFDTPKGGRPRELPLTDLAWSTLKSHRHLKSKFVFCDEDGGHVYASCPEGLARAARKAELGRKIGWHCLRHTFASHLAMKGAALKAVQELLGHSTIDMTMRYAHLSPGAQREAILLLDGRPHGTLTAHGEGDSGSHRTH